MIKIKFLKLLQTMVTLLFMLGFVIRPPTLSLIAKPFSAFQLKGRAVGDVSAKLKELSGLAHCQTTPEWIWAINDKGNEPVLYALSEQAMIVGSYLLPQHSNRDWEDLACGRCLSTSQECLYIGDIGSNDELRKKVRVYMISLPISLDKQSKNQITPIKLVLNYPDGGHNAETLLAHPKLPLLLVITKTGAKNGFRKNPGLYRYAVSGEEKNHHKRVMSYMGEIPLLNILTVGDPVDYFQITGGDFYLDGSWILLTSNSLLYRLPWPFAGKKDIPISVWKNVQRPQVESVAFHRNGKQFWVASEAHHKTEPLFLMDIPGL
ncbi:hypothetical protein WDW89_02755 [Deltaproteobacteria bacterium TL4]